MGILDALSFIYVQGVASGSPVLMSGVRLNSLINGWLRMFRSSILACIKSQSSDNAFLK